jgi:hypothetical protein
VRFSGSSCHSPVHTANRVAGLILSRLNVFDAAAKERRFVGPVCEAVGQSPGGDGKLPGIQGHNFLKFAVHVSFQFSVFSFRGRSDLWLGLWWRLEQR